MEARHRPRIGHACNALRPSENGSGTEGIRLVTAVWGHGWGGRGMTRDTRHARPMGKRKDNGRGTEGK